MSEEWRRLLSLEAGPLLTVDFPLIYELRRPKEGPFWAWSLEGKRALDHNGEGFMRGQCVSDCSPHLPSPPDTKQVLGEGGSRDAEARGEAGDSPLRRHRLGSCNLLCYRTFTGHLPHNTALPSQRSLYRGRWTTMNPQICCSCELSGAQEKG